MNELALHTNPAGAVTATPITREQMLQHFIDSQDVAATSKALYKRTLNLYFAWVEDHKLSHNTITRKEIIQYKESLLTEGYSPLTVGSYLTVVRKFYAFAEANKYYPNVAKEIKTPKKRQVFEKEVLSEDQNRQLNYLLKDKAGESINALRDYAILNLVQLTGLRTIEVIRANVEDITIRSGKRVLLVQGKGRDTKDQLVVLTESAHQPIAQYLEARGKETGGRVKPGEPLFTSLSNCNKGQRLTTRYISKIAKEGLKAIGLNDRRYTAHSLRHTVGTFIYSKTGRIDEVQIALRHSNPATSQIYARKAIETASIENSPLTLLDGLF